jgi:ATP-dependent DNA helicase DinG
MGVEPARAIRVHQRADGSGDTIRLQNQVASTFKNLPVLTGRRNFPCWVGEEIYGIPDNYTADQGACVMGKELCNHAGGDGYHSTDPEQTGLCPYYSQMEQAMAAKWRVTNYAMLLSLPPLRRATSVLLADEGHNVEDAVAGNASVGISKRTFARWRITIPEREGMTVVNWAEWAASAKKKLPPMSRDGRPDFGLMTAHKTVDFLAQLTKDSEGDWLVEQKPNTVEFAPIWGRGFVMENLFGHKEAPPNADAYESAAHRQGGVQKVLLTSATLMGAEYIANTLGFPDGSWAYLDLPSTFPVANRPVNYSPVVGLSAKSTDDDYAKMQTAIDRLIEFYVLNGRPWGMIHAVSNNYRDRILTSSRFSAIMRSDPDEHEAAVNRGEGSILVASNLAEGWDGTDDLCRFILMPKVPFPNLGDRRTRIRMQEDSRSFDHKALVAVVQGAGRGVRHREDFADTWILDANWQQLYARRREWLPDSFTSAYHHKVGMV